MPKKSEAFACKEPSQMEFLFALTKQCWAAVVICLPLTILVSKNMLSIKLFLDEDKCQLSAQTAFRTLHFSHKLGQEFFAKIAEQTRQERLML